MQRWPFTAFYQMWGDVISIRTQSPSSLQCHIVYSLHNGHVFDITVTQLLYIHCRHPIPLVPGWHGGSGQTSVPHVPSGLAQARVGLSLVAASRDNRSRHHVGPRVVEERSKWHTIC